MALVWRPQFIKRWTLHRAACPTPWKVASSKTSDPREQDRSPNIFHNPAQKSNFIISAKSCVLYKSAPFGVGGNYTEFKYQEVGIIGSHLRHWLPQSHPFFFQKKKKQHFIFYSTSVSLLSFHIYSHFMSYFTLDIFPKLLTLVRKYKSPPKKKRKYNLSINESSLIFCA